MRFEIKRFIRNFRLCQSQRTQRRGNHKFSDGKDVLFIPLMLEIHLEIFVSFTSESMVVLSLFCIVLRAISNRFIEGVINWCRLSVWFCSFYLIFCLYCIHKGQSGALLSFLFPWCRSPLSFLSIAVWIRAIKAPLKSHIHEIKERLPWYYGDIYRIGNTYTFQYYVVE